MSVDRVRVEPGVLAGSVVVPGDKSQSHRALLIGALVGEEVAVSGLAASEDVASMARCVRTLGATVTLEPAEDGTLAGTVRGPLGEPDDVLDCGNAGTAMRLLAGVAAGIDGMSVLTGDASLRRRPMGRVVAPLRALGVTVDARAGGSRPPVVVRGGRVRGATWDSPVASAQVKSAVLLAGVTSRTGVAVRSPRASRDHTERLLEHLGCHVQTVIAPGGGELVSLEDPRPLAARPVTVSGDPSSAAFWLAAAAMAGTEVVLPGVLVGRRRDGALRILEQLGATVERRDPRVVAGEDVADLVLRSGHLGGGAEVSGGLVVDAIDELPVLAVVAAVSAGGLVVRDAGELRVKESDRIDGIARLFDALGLVVRTQDDGFEVPGGQTVGGGGSVDADGDHRIAMSAAVGATVAAQPVTIAGFASVPTSYPRFLEHLTTLGGTWQETAP